MTFEEVKRCATRPWRLEHSLRSLEGLSSSLLLLPQPRKLALSFNTGLDDQPVWQP